MNFKIGDKVLLIDFNETGSVSDVSEYSNLVGVCPDNPKSLAEKVNKIEKGKEVRNVYVNSNRLKRLKLDKKEDDWASIWDESAT